MLPGIKVVPPETFQGHTYTFGGNPATVHPTVGVRLIEFLSGAVEGMLQVCPARIAERDTMAVILRLDSGEGFIIALLVDPATFDDNFVLEFPGDDTAQITEGMWAAISRIADEVRREVRPIARRRFEEIATELEAVTAALMGAQIDAFLAEVLDEGGDV